MEDYAYILDWLPPGTGGGFGKSRESLIYAVGDEEFKLFELVPKAGVQVEIGHTSARTVRGGTWSTTSRSASATTS